MFYQRKTGLLGGFVAVDQIVDQVEILAGLSGDTKIACEKR